jgi:hypothetical protein
MMPPTGITKNLIQRLSTILCVVETGNLSQFAMMSQIAEPTNADSISVIRTPALSF